MSQAKNYVRHFHGGLRYDLSRRRQKSRRKRALTPGRIGRKNGEHRSNQKQNKLMNVRAKFTVMSKTDEAGDGTAIISLSPVTSGSAENNSFFKWTPGGSISLSTINPEAAKAFEVGKSYYVDFTPAD